MDSQELVRISKYLSLHLRHRPERLGLQLAPGGWVEVDRLLEAAARDGHPIRRDELERVVVQTDKQRFSFDPSGTRIRANQGHSVDVDLQLQPTEPPRLLYHGHSRAQYRRHHARRVAENASTQRASLS